MNASSSWGCCSEMFFPWFLTKSMLHDMICWSLLATLVCSVHLLNLCFWQHSWPIIQLPKAAAVCNTYSSAICTLFVDSSLSCCFVSRVLEMALVPSSSSLSPNLSTLDSSVMISAAISLCLLAKLMVPFSFAVPPSCRVSADHQFSSLHILAKRTTWSTELLTWSYVVLMIWSSYHLLHRDNSCHPK